MAVPDRPGADLAEALAEQDLLQAAIHRHGALLLRGFGVGSPEVDIDQFTEFVTNLSGPPLDYHERTSPRHAVGGRVFTATDHPARMPIFSHNEQSYSLTFPARLHFMCRQPAQQGGTTTLVDSRQVLGRIRDDLRERLTRLGYRFVRNLRRHTGLSWQEVLQTEDRAVAERYCADNDIQLTWLAGDEARTVQRRDVIAHHPVTGEASWFNHCVFFHVSTLGPEGAAMLRKVFGEDYLPNQTYFGDGTPITDADAATLRAAYTSGLTEVHWRTGDILVVDNVLTSHGRTRYQGGRNVVVSMTGPTTWREVRRQPR